jgi:hypothetical protein
MPVPEIVEAVSDDASRSSSEQPSFAIASACAFSTLYLFRFRDL